MLSILKSGRFQTEYNYFKEEIDKIPAGLLKEELEKLLKNLVKEVSLLDQNHENAWIKNQDLTSSDINRSNIMDLRKSLNLKIQNFKDSQA